MQFIFSRTLSPFSVLTRFVTRKDIPTAGWSHVAIRIPAGSYTYKSPIGDILYEFDQDQVVDSRAFKGVRIYNYPDYMRTLVTFHEVTTPDVMSAEELHWLLCQIGKSYDYTALLTFIAPNWLTGSRNWGLDSRWFCSELTASLLCKLRRTKLWPHLNSVSPNKLANYLQTRL